MIRCGTCWTRGSGGLGKLAALGISRRLVKDPEVQNYLRMPVGYADQKNNRLPVCDTLRSRLQIYHKDKDYMDPQFNL